MDFQFQLLPMREQMTLALFIQVVRARRIITGRVSRIAYRSSFALCIVAHSSNRINDIDLLNLHSQF